MLAGVAGTGAGGTAGVDGTVNVNGAGGGTFGAAITGGICGTPGVEILGGRGPLVVVITGDGAGGAIDGRGTPSICDALSWGGRGGIGTSPAGITGGGGMCPGIGVVERTGATALPLSDRVWCRSGAFGLRAGGTKE